MPMRRRPEGGSPGRQPPPGMAATDAYPDAARYPRSRPEDASAYAVDQAGWAASQQIAGTAYPGGPLVSAQYSDERTVLSGDYPAVNNHQYSQSYQEQSSGARAEAWQTTERASVRLAARASAPSMPMSQHPQPQMPYPPAPMAYYPAHMHYGPVPMMPPPQPPPPAAQQQPQQQPSKRPAEEEPSSSPKSKKAKAKPKGTPTAEGASGPSKRGYNAKKRSEAAQIVAQNAQMMPTVAYASGSADKGKEKAPDATMQMVEDGAAHPEGSGPLHPELQFARCMSNRYKAESFPRCVSCTRRWAGDTCRFQGIRFFLKDDQRNIVGISFVENQKADAPSMSFPSKWNAPLLDVHTRRVKRTIAQALLPTLRTELEHLSKPEIIRRPRESEVRATCDTCMTSIFSSSWMCRLCGREACSDCFQQVKDLTEDRPGATEAQIAALQARREKHAHSNPFFLSCTRRNEHQWKEFSPMSRFCKSELAQAIQDMEALLLTPDEDALPPTEGAIDPALESQPPADVSQATATGAPAEPEVIPPIPNAPANAAGMDIPYHVIKRFTDTELTDDVFRPIWARGEPMVVTDILHKFQLQWTPEYFIEKYGTQNCLIVECQTEANKRITVGEFFSWFGKYEGRKECWKLKDWPPSTDFKSAFPELYEDFNRAVPVPNYVRRDGVLNIASHFPSNTVAPDLGPKMYNAMASSETSGSKGSTRLHMDMADAVNIMTYASLTADGSPGCAAWDIFRAEDSDKIRKYLRKHSQGGAHQDPIHAQFSYLDASMRKDLWEGYGVKSYRIYQRPGEAVFIPAGCAHQVANLSDCIKVAVDFVSPENIDRCERLTREFREQNQSMVWKEDVLQLRSMMWFAWLSCCRQEQD